MSDRTKSPSNGEVRKTIRLSSQLASKWDPRLVRQALKNGISLSDKSDNQLDINELIRPLNLRIILLENILRKMVPEMIKKRCNVPLSQEEFDEVIKFK